MRGSGGPTAGQATARPLVSVVIPVYNGEAYLAEALDSVFAQTHRPLEVIVVDDGSTDLSAEIARAVLGVRYCAQPHSGPGASRNLGVSQARGRFLAFLDADDLWPVGKLARQLAAFDADPTLDIVYGHVQQFRRPAPAGATVEDERIGGPVPGHVPGTALIRRESFLRVGPIATHLRVGEFIDWYARAQEAGLNSLMLPEVLLKRRVHTENLGIGERASRTDYVRVLKASLDRRRAHGAQPAGSDDSTVPDAPAPGAIDTPSRG